MRHVRVGLFGIGLDAYWPQFAGLKERLEGYIDIVAGRLERPGVEVVNLGLIDTPEKALVAGHQFRREDVDLIFLYITTYALSATVLPVVQRARVPVVVLSLQPVAAIDYSAFNAMGDRTAMTGEWLACCAACPAPELANVFRRARIDFHQVTGMLHDDPVCWAEIDAWVEAARVASVMSHNRLGLMGHYYGGMLDIYSDLTRHCATFGGHVELLEVDELAAHRREIGAGEVQARVGRVPLPPRRAARLLRSRSWSAPRAPVVALDRLVADHDLGFAGLLLQGLRDVAEHEDAMSSIILGNSLLTARGVPVAGEYEVKNVQAMKILDSLGAGGSFTEYYAMDFTDDVVLMGHDGPGHIAIAEGKTKVRPLQVYHGKVGHGLSVEMSGQARPGDAAVGVRRERRCAGVPARGR